VIGVKVFIPVVLGAVLLTPAAASGDVYEDVIYLEDGSIIRGTIVEEVPGETYKIEIAGGSVLVFEADEVEKVVRETATREEDREAYSSFYEYSNRYRSLLFGFAAVVGRYSGWDGILLYGGEFTVGWRFHPLYAGALGFGYNRATYDDYWGSYNIAYNFVPIYVHNRITYLRTEIIGLYGELDIGYGLVYIDDWPGQHGGMLYGFGQGFEFGPPRFHGDVSIGLRNQSFEGGSSGNNFIVRFGFSL
jgi:hypothetical protein